MIPLILLHLLSVSAQSDLCEPAVDPSPSCLCTRLDFMDTYSFRLRFGNSTFAGSNYQVYSPSFNQNYNCVTEEPLHCGSSDGDVKSAAFAVFNMKYVLELSDRIPSVFCHPNVRMFDMDNALIGQFQAAGELPSDELHLTEVGCIQFSSSPFEPSSSPPFEKSSTKAIASSTVAPGCTCSMPPPVMTQSLFNYKFAWQFPKSKYEFGSPQFTYTEGCQSVSMVCDYPVSKVLKNEKQSQKALMFFSDYIISGNDIRDVASRFNLHCDSASNTWRFDAASEEKFDGMLGSTVRLTELGCATITE